jgi:hypothetical protein
MLVERVATTRDASSFALTARRRIAQELRALAILSMPRSSALLNYLTVLEAESVKATLFSAASPVAALGAHRQAVESSAHAIPAIFEQCPPDEALVPLTVTREVIGLANELFIFTQKYDQIEYCYKLAERGHFEISVAKKDPRITFSYSSPEEDQANTPARAREILPRFSEGRSSPNQGAISEISERLGVALAPQTRLVQPETCEYVLNGDVLSVVRLLFFNFESVCRISLNASHLGSRSPQKS